MALTEGGIQALLDGNKMEGPVFRISNLKPATIENSKIRVVLSDGIMSHSYCILGNNSANLYESGQLKIGTVIRLDKYATRCSNDQKVLFFISEATIMANNNNENCAPLSTPVQVAKNVAVAPPKTIKAQVPTAHVPAAAAPAQIQPQVSTININLLNSYQNKWAIKGQVMKKDNIRTWSNAKGEGKLFSFIIADETCDLKITAFGQEVDKFFNIVEVDKTYIVSKGQVKSADRRFNSTKCDHEVTLNNTSEIREVLANPQMPVFQFNFVELDKIKDVAASEFVDVIGVAHEIKESSKFLSKKTNKETVKTDVVFVDRSGCSITLTVWGDDIKLLDNLEHPVIAVRSAVVSDFNGRTLSVGFRSTMRVNPDNLPEASALLGWYEGEGHQITFRNQGTSSGSSISTKKVTIGELTCTDAEKSEYYTVECMVGKIKRENLVYKSCLKCNKKVIDQHNGMYMCSKCGVEDTDFKFRLLVNANVADCTGNIWVTIFQDMAENVLGITAEKIGNMIENEMTAEVDALIANAIYRNNLMCKLRVSNDTYNDETRMKSILTECAVLEPEEYLSKLLAELTVE